MMTHRIESSSAQQCMSQQQCATRRQVCALDRARRAGQQPGFLLCKRAGRRNAQGCRVVAFDCAQRGWFRTRAPSDARCVCSSPRGRPLPFECGPSRADRRSGHCARSRRSLRPHFSIVFKYSNSRGDEYLRIYSCGQITLDPQNFGRKQKRSKLQSDLVVRIFHTRLRLNSKIFVPGQKKVSCGHSHDEIRLGN